MAKSAFSTLACVSLALLLGCCGRDSNNSATNTPKPPATPWQTVTADDNTYTVSLPAKPMPINQSVDVPQGKININMQNLSDEDVEYAVGYSEYPAGFLATMGADAPAIFAKARDATVKQRQATLLEDKDGKIGEFPSRTLVMTFNMQEAKDHVTMKQVLILAKGRMYIAQTIVPSHAPPQATADAATFHSSFALNVK